MSEDSENIKKITFRSAVKAILKSRFLVVVGIGSYLVHILYVFILFTLVIWTSMMIDITLAKVEKNKKEIDELKIVWSDMIFREAEATSRKAVEANLKSLGSDVGEPVEPATMIGNGR